MMREIYKILRYIWQRPYFITFKSPNKTKPERNSPAKLFSTELRTLLRSHYSRNLVSSNTAAIHPISFESQVQPTTKMPGRKPSSATSPNPHQPPSTPLSSSAIIALIFDLFMVVMAVLSLWQAWRQQHRQRQGTSKSIMGGFDNI